MGAEFLEVSVGTDSAPGVSGSDSRLLRGKGFSSLDSSEAVGVPQVLVAALLHASPGSHGSLL